jgi:hypothetical protein
MASGALRFASAPALGDRQDRSVAARGWLGKKLGVIHSNDIDAAAMISEYKRFACHHRGILCIMLLATEDSEC